VFKKAIRRCCAAGEASRASRPSPLAGTLFYSIIVGALSDDLALRAYCPETKVRVRMEIGINKKEYKHKGQLGGGAANSSNLKRINLALQGGGSHGAPLSPLISVQMPANENNGRSSLSANHTTSFFLVSGFGSGAYSAKLFAGIKQRLSGLSQARQCGDDVFLMFVTGYPPARGGHHHLALWRSWPQPSRRRSGLRLRMPRSDINWWSCAVR
jgi:hypothetical protein